MLKEAPLSAYESLAINARVLEHPRRKMHNERETERALLIVRHEIALAERELRMRTRHSMGMAPCSALINRATQRLKKLEDDERGLCKPNRQGDRHSCERRVPPRDENLLRRERHFDESPSQETFGALGKTVPIVAMAI